MGKLIFFLAAQTVKGLPAMQETQVQSLGWEDPLEEGMATHSSILAWKNPMDGGAWQAIQSMGLQRVKHNLVTEQQQMSTFTKTKKGPRMSCM